MPFKNFYVEDALANLKGTFYKKVKTDHPKLEKLIFEPVDVTTIPLIEDIIEQATVLIAHVKQDALKEKSCKLPSPIIVKTEDEYKVEDEDFMGCPLESPFILNDFDNDLLLKLDTSDSVTEYLRQPLPAIEGKLLLNMYSLELLKMYKGNDTSSTLDVKPLVVLCDQTDTDKTALIGMAKFTKLRSLTFQVKVFEGVVEDGLPSLESLKTQHRKLFRKSNTKVDALSEYSILDSDYSSYLKIECQWTNAKEILSIPSATAACSLKIKICPSEDRSPLSVLYKELSLLRNAVSALKTLEMSWMLYSADTDKLCIDIVKELFDAMRDSEVWTPSQTFGNHVDSSDLAECLENLAIGKKQSGDFTDNLWLALRGCSSYKELQEALGHVVDSVHSGNVHPMVPYQNQTTLGKWIRRSTAGEAEKLNLNDATYVFQIFSELGIEKLRNDYLDAFIEMELVTQDLLKHYISPASSDPTEAVSSLLKLHIILEMVIMCKGYLHLPAVHLGSFARKALKAFEKVDGALAEDFEMTFPMKVSITEPILKGIIPEEWKVSLKTEEPNYSFQTIALFSQKPIFRLPNQKKRSTSNGNDPYYYAAVLNSCMDEH